MAKKKKQYPKRSRNILIGCIITLGVLLLAGGGIAASIWWTASQRNYIGTVDGTKVSVGEFKLNLFEQQLNYESYYGTDVWTWDLGTDYTVADIAKDSAYNSTMSNIIASIKAKEYGVDKLTEEQAASVEETIGLFHQYYGDGVISYLGLSDDELRSIFSADYYSQNLFELITDESYVFDEAAYDADFAVYYEENLPSLRGYVLQYIITEDEAAINEAMAKYEAGAEFADLMAEYSYDYKAPEAETGDTEDVDNTGETAPTESPAVSPEPTETAPTESPAVSPGPTEAVPTESPAVSPGPTETVPAETPKSTGEPSDELTETNAPEEPAETNAPGGEDDYLDLSEFDYVFDYSEYDMDVNIYTLFGSELPSEIASAVYELEIGSVTAIIPLWSDDYTYYSDYIILKLIDVIEPDTESEKSTYMETYISEAKNELYNPIFSAWADEFEVVRNDKAYDSTTIYGY